MKRLITTTFILGLFASPVMAANECKSVKFAQAPWTGLSAKTETAAWMLSELGYETDVTTADLGVIYQGVANKDSDAFLGLWLPEDRQNMLEHAQNEDIDLIGPNVKGDRQGIAVPEYVYEAGVRSMDDLDEYREKFESKMYVLSAGNPLNEYVQEIIDDDQYGLGDWEKVSSSAAGMMAQVERHISNDEWIAFIGWQPHPMNLNYDIKYLEKGELMGNQKEKAIYTIASTGYPWKCQNVGQFLSNYTFTLDEQSRMAKYVLDEDMDYAEAGRALIRNKPELLERWFALGGAYQSGPIKTADGSEDASEAIKEALQE